MKAFGLANLGRDVELKYTPSGDPVADLILAFNYGRKGEDGKRPVQWVRASLWGKRAEALAPYLLKGTRLMANLEDVHYEPYQTHDGQTGTMLAARVADIELAGGGEHQQAAPARTPARQAPARPAPQNNGYRTSSARQAPAAAPGSGFDDMTDDVPF